MLARSSSYSEQLENYLAEIKKIPLLTPEDERKLAYKIREGDSRALNELVNGNYRFVVSMAKNYTHSNYSNRSERMLELIQEGNIALIRAAETFNPDLGLRFISYAVWWIRKCMFHYMGHQGQDLKIPERKLAVYFKLKKIADKLYQDIKKEPNDKELLEAFSGNHTYLDFYRTIVQTSNAVSYDSILNEIESRPSEEKDSLSETNKSELSREINHVLSKLREKERTSVELYFGFNGQEKMSYEKIGKVVKLSREGARRTLQRALGKLKRDPEALVLKTYLFED